MNEDVKELIEATANATSTQWQDSPETGGCCGGSPQSNGHGCGCHAPANNGADAWEERLRQVINKVRPFLQMDGGDMELLAIEDRSAVIRLTGACHGCPSAAMHMKHGVEEAIRKELPDFKELVTVEF